MSANFMPCFWRFLQQFLPFCTALNISDPESGIIPLEKLPYGFRSRIIDLSMTAKIRHNFIRACSTIERFEPYWDDHDQVFITDNHVVCKRAMKDTFFFRVCKCLDQFTYWRNTKDGQYTIFPVWKSVLLVDEILDRDKDIFVHDTLILNCQIQGYEKVIPRIVGPYTRLVVDGRIRWDQLKRLIHRGVKQVRVSGRIVVEPLDYDDFVGFIIRHCRGIDSIFSFGSSRNYNHEVMARLYAACRIHKTHKVFYTSEEDKYHVTYKGIQGNEIFVHDTLILNCQIEGFEKVIPRIVGPYTRLVVDGRIKWDQLKRLIHRGVKQVRVSGRIVVEPLDYDDFVDFILQHCRGIEYT
uniref:F-box domain-containing protein n=1 Tax=Panagrellus redivivus TaxID=6233 RepID=A0A7E4V8I9_PANRE